MSELAQHAYDAHGAALSWKDERGNDIPPWQALTPAAQQAWRASSRAILEMIGERCMSHLDDFMQNARPAWRGDAE